MPPFHGAGCANGPSSLPMRRARVPPRLGQKIGGPDARGRGGPRRCRRLGREHLDRRVAPAERRGGVLDRLAVDIQHARGEIQDPVRQCRAARYLLYVTYNPVP